MATLPAFLFVLYVASQARAAALHQAEREAGYVAGVASREHAHQVLGAKRLLGQLAEDFQSGRISLPELNRVLPAVLHGFPQFANLGILRTDGRLDSSVIPPERPVDMAGNPAFQSALASGGAALGPYQMGPIVGRPVVIAAQALRDPGGKPAGILFAALDLAWLDQVARQALLPKDFTLLLADRGGRVLADSEGSGPRVAKPGDVLPGFEALRTSHGELQPRRSQDGLLKLFTATPLDGVPDLWVAVGLSERQVMGQANRAFARSVAALLALTLLAVASSIAAADLSVLREVRQLAKATRQFGSGDLTVRAPVPATPGEFQDLALAFNAMAEVLDQRHREALAAQEQLRALSHRIQAAREEEGARISRELHDQLGQELTSLKLELARVKRQLAQACPATANGAVGVSLEQMGQQIDECVDSVRRISAELRPSVLDRLGLGPALEWLAREFERRTSVPCLLEGCVPGLEIAPDTATALFRITQEALTNVARHAEARVVHLRLHAENHDLRLTIEDDGRGIRPGPPNASLGLLGMQERMRLAGGLLTIEPGLGGGTRISAQVSLGQEEPLP